MRKSVFCCFFILCLVSNAFATPKQLHIMVSIAPQSYLVEKIAKKLAKVSILLPQNMLIEEALLKELDVLSADIKEMLLKVA